MRTCLVIRAYGSMTWCLEYVGLALEDSYLLDDYCGGALIWRSKPALAWTFDDAYHRSPLFDLSTRGSMR